MQPSGDIVRIQLVFGRKDPGSWPEEVIKKRTSKGNEVVDSNGFTFVRKRKAEDPPQPQPSAPLTGGSNVDEACTAACKSHIDLSAAGGNAPEAPVQGHGSMDSEGIMPNHDAAAESPMEQANGQALDTQPADAVPIFEDEVQELLLCVPAACPKAIQAKWLFEQVLQLAVSRASVQGAAVADAAALTATFTAALDGEVANARALLNGNAEQLAQFEQMAPMIKSACAEDVVVAGLRRQLEELQQEEAAWLALERTYGSTASPDASTKPPAMNPVPAFGAAPSPGVVQLTPNVVARAEALPGIQRQANMKLAFQVEAIGSLIDKAARLVEQAEEACVLLQADYHKESFQAYPHVDSPMVLVKLLSQQATQPNQH